MFGENAMSELALSIVGGVLTAVILELFRPRSRGGAEQTQRAPRERRPDGFMAGFIRLLLAVVGGVLTALLVGRYLFQNEIIERSPAIRVALLVGGTVLSWSILTLFRRR